MNEELKNSVSLMGFKIYDGNESDIISQSGKVINTLNPYSYIISLEDPLFSKALGNSDFLIPDGIGITLAIRILLGRKIRRITGPNLMDFALQSANKNNESVFFMGSTNKVLSKIQSRIKREFPNIRVGLYSPPFADKFSEEQQYRIISAINLFSPDHLFIGMTAPKQEKWVFKSQHSIKCNKIYSVGAAFDWYAGTKIRPPKFIENIGLGFIFRLILEPRMWQRQKFNMLFVLKVMRKKFFESSSGS